MKLWVTRGDRWVPTFVLGPGKKCYLKITNASDRVVWLQEHDRIGMWLAEGRVPRLPGYVLVGSRRYAEWQNLAYQAAADEIDDVPEVVDLPGPAVERPLYATPTRILPRPTAISPGSRAASPE
ncbi:hypothetical protein F441_22528, partial [Phytophthora nicotianae CJ01A1]